jgi:TonB family protein
VGAASLGAEPIVDASSVAFGTVLLWIWIGGACVRFTALLIGACGLRRLRRRSAVAQLSDEIESLRLSLAPHAEFRWSSSVAQPVAFGLRRPVVLLPLSFNAMTLDAQHAVAHHELWHVRRRDWAWIVIEEQVRALFWFHPGVWWLVEQVQLAREQVIDGLVVSTMASRRTYMEALLAFADRGSAASMSIAFMRRRHLRSRLRHLSREVHMSFRRLAWITAVLAVVTAAAAVAAARSMPLNLSALSLQTRSGPRLEITLAETAPGAGLKEAVVSGSDRRVYLHASPLATDADVTSASVIDTGGQFGVGVRFSGAAAARMAGGTAAHVGKPLAIVLDGQVISAPTLRAAISDSAVISGTFTAASAEELAARLSPSTRQNGAARDDGTVLPVPIHEERPQYTPAALDARIQGNVLLEAVVLADGSVGDVTVVQSLDPTYGLDQQAVAAMKLWTFKPGTRGGQPVRVAVEVQMTFTLK